MTGMFGRAMLRTLALMALAYIAVTQLSTSMQATSRHLLVLDNDTVAASVPPPSSDSEPARLCEANQYKSSLKSSLTEIADQMDQWLEDESYIERLLRSSEQESLGGRIKNMWMRFEAFQEMSECDKTCVGGRCSADTSKQVCGLSLLKAPCVVYSIGGNNHWEFEKAILKETPCEVHTFDCTGKEKRFKVPHHERLHFHYVCLGPDNRRAPKTIDANARKNSPRGEFWTLEKIQSTLNHTRIDLLKMDIEGYEWPILHQWPLLTERASLSPALPMQVLVEVHYRDQHPGFDTGIVALQSRLLRMGYATIINDPNPRCPHCVELTLMRIRC